VGPFGIFVPGPSPVPPFAGTTIDFEGFAESTLIAAQYAGSGVTFTQDDGGTPMIDNKSLLFAYETGSGVGVLTGSATGGSTETTAGLVADFSPPVSKAGAFMSDTAPLGSYTVTIFDSGGVVIDTVVLVAADFPSIPGYPSPDPSCDSSPPFDGTGCGVWVGFDTGTNNIARIQIGRSTASGDAFAIDDLVFAEAAEVLEPKLDAIEVKLDELKPEVVDLKAEVTDVKAEVADLKAETVDIRNQQNVIQAQNADIKAEMVDVKAEITDSKAEIVDIAVTVVDTKAELIDVKAELVDVKAELTDAKAEIADISDSLEFKIDFELEQALLTCGCTPSLYLPEPGGKIDRALALLNAQIDNLEDVLDPDVESKLPWAQCYVDVAAALRNEGAFKQSCLALGSATQLLDGHLPGDDDSSIGLGQLCLKVKECKDFGDDDD
jgi:hypothetical protein